MEMDTDGVVNDMLNIRINENDEITSFAIVGGVGDDGIFVSYEVAPENFMTDFQKGYFLYKNDVISENPNFKPIVDTV
ncbi:MULTISPECIES: DUF2977 domain-containing protein [Staphylococcus]|uniref:DUF2977 domain-containing protein n=1 Tax=Staphylococcus TaxID=1279 RepID=UPI00209DCD8C|nr:DUF2977 domain-containing protein [Staphylococcus equorum]MEB7746294.1 DUF2977 domain-containing protein [Staphylococcus equorum]UTT55144.1 DUF2977 domain-containing protein [Staphylococcus equorum]UTT55205.1 DUF2977 domain-containing protein [Staphylococcus equorum]